MRQDQREKLRRNYIMPRGEYRDPPVDVEPVSKFLHDERNRRGFSSTEFSELTGVSQSVVCKAERGGFVSLATFQTLLKFYGYTLVLQPLPTSEVETDIE